MAGQSRRRESSLVAVFFREIFIDGLSGMALGLFSTLIIGTILGQAAGFLPSPVDGYVQSASLAAKTITGAGIGMGVAQKLRARTLTSICAAVAGMVGAFPSILSMEAMALGRPGEPLGAFLAALAAVWIGRLVEGRTGLDILLTPLAAILGGSAAGMAAGEPISAIMLWLGNLVNINVERYPIVGGAVVSVLMGIILTLPISSAALGLSMGISGLAAGAATVGCCCNMVGFAVISYRENKLGGLIAQGLGTSMLQMPNIVKNPLIWLPSILSSAILGPVSSAVLRMTNTPIGSGMGTSGLVGQIAALSSLQEGGRSLGLSLALIGIMHFLLPAVLSLAIAEWMRGRNWIRYGDMSLGRE